MNIVATVKPTYIINWLKYALLRVNNESKVKKLTFFGCEIYKNTYFVWMPHGFKNVAVLVSIEFLKSF